jgi:hypothetical protein
MIRQYRPIKKGEFFVIGGDCSQGGIDSNWVQFLSKDKIDVPLVLEQRGVASDMTPVLHHTLEWLFDKTGVQPIVALERNMGGASEMERLRKLNRLNKYRLYLFRRVGTSKGEKLSDTLGYITDAISRPTLVGDLKVAVDNIGLKIYDEETINQLSTFIVNKSGKPEAAPNTHDDAVMSLAIAWQLYQTEDKILLDDDDEIDMNTGNITSLWG